MADLHTIYTDDDGDGIFDDVHVVNVHHQETNYIPERPYYPESHNHVKSTSSTKIFSFEQKVKIGLVIGAILLASLMVLPSIVILRAVFGM